jgi:Flp pilus assembly protein TadG
MKTLKQKRLTSSRRGATAVEFAMTAPLVFLLLFGALELSHANMVFNTTEAAAYEGAREGIVPGASAADCVAAAQRILDISRIRGATISVTPADLATDTNTITVSIAVPYASNTIVAPVFTETLRISGTCELNREKL